MTTARTIEVTVDLAEVDDAGQLCVEGPLPVGVTVGLAPRRYKSKPAWWGVEVVGIGPSDAPIVEGRRYRLECPAEHVTGREGIEILGAGDPISIPVE